MTDFPCSTNLKTYSNFQIFFISPYEYPDRASSYIRFMYPEINSTNYLIFFLITQTVSTPSVKYLHVTQRKCVFRNEIKLDVSNVYSRQGCEMQCKYGKIMDKCGCFLPGFYNSGENVVQLHKLWSIVIFIALIPFG